MYNGLLPKTPPVGEVRIDRELPDEARKWGRIIDLSNLEAGDLILTRLVNAKSDRITRKIMEAQEKGGFHRRHAQWTHAAVYLGDDEHICEATFKFPGLNDLVAMRSAHTYCDGTYAIRARRPKNMSPKQRLRIAIGALTNLGSQYSYRQILEFALAAYSGKRIFGAARIVGRQLKRERLFAQPCIKTRIISHFRSTLRMGSLCTPAHLSASDDFEPTEPVLNWLSIA